MLKPMNNFQSYLREQLYDIEPVKRERIVARVTKKFNDTIGDIKLMIARELSEANIEGIHTRHLTRLYVNVDKLLES